MDRWRRSGDPVSPDLMTNALEGYTFLKIAGKGEGLDALRQMLSTRFSRSPNRPGPALDMPL